jgi:hypothetical protein
MNIKHVLHWIDNILKSDTDVSILFRCSIVSLGDWYDQTLGWARSCDGSCFMSHPVISLCPCVAIASHPLSCGWPVVFSPYHFTRLQIQNRTPWPSLFPDWPTLLFLSADKWLHWPSVPTHLPAAAFFMDILTLEDETTVLSSSGLPSAQWCGTTCQKSGGVNCTSSKA